MSEPAGDWTDGQEVLLVTRCGHCTKRWYLPHVHCPVCGSADHVREPAQGTGVCVAVTRLHVTAGDETGPVRLGLFELVEGPVVMGRIHDEELVPGDRARVEFRLDGHGGALVPSFARAGVS